MVSAGQLRGSRFQRLFPDVYVLASSTPDLAVRSLAAHVLIEGCGVLAGYSAAELLGASCGPDHAPAEVSVPGSERRSRPGLLVHRFRPHTGEIEERNGIRMTTPLRTAYDLARRLDLGEAVVAVDALAHRRFAPAVVLELAAGHRGDRGVKRLRQVVSLADSRSESPMESRIRVAIARHGLPLPEVQFPVSGYRLDLAYPEVRLGIEYDGRDHRTSERALRDLQREADFTTLGWTIRRFPARVVHRPHEVAILVWRELVGRGLDLPSVSCAR